MADAFNPAADAPLAHGPASPRVESRVTLTSPSRTIRVQQVRISEQQKSSVASAIRAGRNARTSE
jgi:hypothetical protein